MKSTISAPALHRFIWSIDVDKNTGCWNWTRSRTPSGYGVFCENMARHAAHRWAYTRFVGPIPDGLELDHLCRNRGCCNPKHVEPVTHRENMLRSPALGTFWKAVTHCPQGHPYSGDNLVLSRQHNGTRQRRECLICKRRVRRESARRKRAESLKERKPA